MLSWSAWNESKGFFIGGGQIGYNYVASPLFLVGLETDIQGASGQLQWAGTVRGRVGVTPFNSSLLIHGTGGFAYGQIREYFGNGWAWNGWNSSSAVKTGWTAGGGVEWSFQPNMSIKVEYLYARLYANNNNNNNWWGGWDGSRNSWAENIVRLGLNYHWVGAPAPVVAKY